MYVSALSDSVYCTHLQLVSVHAFALNDSVYCTHLHKCECILYASALSESASASALNESVKCTRLH